MTSEKELSRRKKISETMKAKGGNKSSFKKGMIPWNKDIKTNIIPWNKDLTKYNDKRLMIISQKTIQNNPMKSLETRKKVSLSLKGRKLNNYHKIKISQSIKQSYIMGSMISWNKGLTGKTDERLKISNEKQLGRIPWNKNGTMQPVTKETRQKLSKSLKNSYIKNPKLRQLRREFAIKRIERQKLNGMPLTPAIGKHEKQILDNLEKCFNYKIIRQHRVNGYFLDGYIPSLNLAIEVDENHHFCNKKLKEKDIIRQKEIKSELNCNFLRIKDKRGDSHFSTISN